MTKDPKQHKASHQREKVFFWILHLYLIHLFSKALMNLCEGNIPAYLHDKGKKTLEYKSFIFGKKHVKYIYIIYILFSLFMSNNI